MPRNPRDGDFPEDDSEGGDGEPAQVATHHRRMRPVLVDGKMKWVPIPGADGGSGGGDAGSAGHPHVDLVELASKHRKLVMAAAAALVLWAIGRYYSSKWALLATILLGFVVIFSNLGKREDGTLSAWSIFNRNGERIAGTTTSDHYEAHIRGGSAGANGGSGIVLAGMESLRPFSAFAGDGHRLDSNSDDGGGGAEGLAGLRRRLQAQRPPAVPPQPQHTHDDDDGGGDHAGGYAGAHDVDDDDDDVELQAAILQSQMMADMAKGDEWLLRRIVTGRRPSG